MAADSTADLVVNQKSNFQVTFLVKDGNSIFDLSGYSVSAKLKTSFQASDDSAVAFTTSTNTATGGVTISLTAAQTANLDIQRYVYDVAITSPSPDSFKTRIVEGKVIVSGGVA